MVQRAALDLSPHRVIYYLQDMAGKFHGFYSKHRVLSEDVELAQARLSLVDGLRIVFHNGLTLLGVKAPERM
jgi:arginyl-tRNA synthetase